MGDFLCSLEVFCSSYLSMIIINLTVCPKPPEITLKPPLNFRRTSKHGHRLWDSGPKQLRCQLFPRIQVGCSWTIQEKPHTYSKRYKKIISRWLLNPQNFFNAATGWKRSTSSWGKGKTWIANKDRVLLTQSDKRRFDLWKLSPLPKSHWCLKC